MHRILLVTLLPLLVLVPGRGAVAAPLELTASSAVPGREVALCIHRPSAPGPHPVIVFSQDLGTSCHANADLGRHWASAGYLGVFVEHPGGTSVAWDQRPPRRTPERRAVGSDARLDDRAGDVRGVLDALERWSRDASHPLHRQADTQRVGVAGEFWGATTAGVLAGQRTGSSSRRLNDRRIRAALQLDPVGPRAPAPSAAYGAVRVPLMLVFGRRSDLRHGAWAPGAIEGIWPALRTSGSCELVFRDALAPATPYERTPRGRDPSTTTPRQADREAAVRQLSTSFWDATLRRDASGRRGLSSSAARGLLEPGDRWRCR